MAVLGQVWCLIVSVPDLCPLSYFFLHFLTFLHSFAVEKLAHSLFSCDVVSIPLCIFNLYFDTLYVCHKLIKPRSEPFI